MAQRQTNSSGATPAALPAARRASGGESFSISTEGFSSARVAMNRPPRLSSQQQASTAPVSATAGAAAAPTARRVSQTGRTAAAAGKSSDAPHVVIETPTLQSPNTTACLFGVTPTGSLPSELCSPTLGSTPPALPAPAPGGWSYVPPPNNQRSFFFEEDGLHFTSEFDSGNLIQVERVSAMKYMLYSCPDCGNSAAQTNNRQWFHFAVRGGVKGAVLQMQVIGLMNCKMYSTIGWTPVAAVYPSKPTYQRVGTRVVVQKLSAGPPTPGYPNLTYKPFGGGDDDGDNDEQKKERKEPDTVALNLSFDYRFEVDVPVTQQVPFGSPECPAVFIASNHPYNVERQKRSIATWSKKAAASPNTLLYREVLCRSLDGRDVDLLTITANTGKSSGTEPPCFPGIPWSTPPEKEGEPVASDEGLEGDETVLTTLERPSVSLPPVSAIQRPPVFPSKRYVLLTARVHPGETPASHIMQGAIDFLLDPTDPRSAQLLKDYVFVVVPMINPDGVARGHSRADTTGQNLNRMYRNPDPTKHPTIFALRHLMLALQGTGRLALYIDMHAHANKKGAFFFGNAMSAVDQVQNLLYPKLVALNTPHFEFTGCNFSESNMFAMGKNGETKDGSSRVTIFQETGFVHSYTIESSYVTGNGQNPIAANPAIPGEELDVLAGTPSPKYNQGTFADVGKALLVALLDFHGVNPCSRLPNGPHRSLKGVTTWLHRWLMFEVFEWLRKQIASNGGALIAAKPSAASAMSSINLETVSPLTLSVSTMMALDITSDPLTLRGCKELPPTTFNNFPELLALMKREQSATAANSGTHASASSGDGPQPAASSRSAPPVARTGSMTRTQAATNKAVEARKLVVRPSSRR